MRLPISSGLLPPAGEQKVKALLDGFSSDTTFYRWVCGRYPLRDIASQNLSDHVAFLVEKLGCKIPALKERELIDQARLSLLVHVGESKPGVASWEDELDAELIADIAKLGASLAITVMWPLPEDENPS